MRKQTIVTRALQVLLGLMILFLVILLLKDNNFAVLNPAGTIAHSQRNLMIFAGLLSLFVVIPVFGLLFAIIWKYRESNTEATYTPEWDHNRVAETLWWAIPASLILVLSVVTWRSSHSLDPYRPLESQTHAMTIQVIALDWRWLFIYPDQHIATINDLHIPVNTPINFEITSDAPMNSFWIPQLGGQVYAMSGMSTQLHLMASKAGVYRGMSANLSGEGFAGMKFNATAANDAGFATWMQRVRKSDRRLTSASYAELAKPSQDATPIEYAAAPADLYNSIIMKYMGPMHNDHMHMEGTDH